MVPDQLGINGFVLLQDEEHLKLGTDAMLLSDFARIPKGARVADLGCGNGAIFILLAARHPSCTLHGVEIQEKSYHLAAENIRLNHIEDRAYAHCADLRDLSFLPSDSFDVVVSNPPYMKSGSGLKAENPALLAARMEIDCTIEDVCRSASRLLKFGGSFSLVYRPDRLEDLFSALKAANLAPKRMRLVQNKVDAAPSLVLLEARKGGKPGMVHLPVLCIREASGEETAEIKEIYQR
ncbi:MAG: tRNA1(Val) (adenine(37)-N6)-methyltransferase [Oscillospiraceae bacterium]|nr:tRNA1(Val) (adenine(37)-N6)-methyltransferase [Oscillospiraceae bacterium]